MRIAFGRETLRTLRNSAKVDTCRRLFITSCSMSAANGTSTTLLCTPDAPPNNTIDHRFAFAHAFAHSQQRLRDNKQHRTHMGARACSESRQKSKANLYSALKDVWFDIASASSARIRLFSCSTSATNAHAPTVTRLCPHRHARRRRSWNDTENRR
jgi:hypothetical protein